MLFPTLLAICNHNLGSTARAENELAMELLAEFLEEHLGGVRRAEKSSLSPIAGVAQEVKQLSLVFSIPPPPAPPRPVTILFSLLANRRLTHSLDTSRRLIPDAMPLCLPCTAQTSTFLVRTELVVMRGLWCNYARLTPMHPQQESLPQTRQPQFIYK